MSRTASQFSIFRRIFVVAAALLLSGTAARAQQTLTVKASFEPAQLAAGRQGDYRLDINGSFNGMRGTVPIPAGLSMDMRQSRTSYSTNINANTGSVESIFTIRYRVTAAKPGEYTIPTYELDLGGNKVTVPAATLEVTDKPVAVAAGLPNDDQLCVLNASVPRKDLYIGEKFPLDISLIHRANVDASPSQIEQDGDGFDHVRLYDNWEKNEFTDNGITYASDTWHFAVTALKGGEQKLSFTMPAQVAVGGPGVLPINDPMFAQFFGRNSPFAQQETINVQSTPLVLNVQPLPVDGRPANFSGAIGNFSIGDANLSTTDLQVGVPVTLKISVTGRGNFDSLHPPTIESTSEWRSYAPKDNFTASDRTGFSGTKTFEYVLIPMSENISQLDPPEVNFFNPDQKSYIDLAVKPINVTVKPAAPGQTPAPLPAVAVANPGAQTTELVGLHFDAGTMRTPQPRPIFTSPYFLAAQALPAVVLGALVITRRRRLRIENDPVFARRLRAQKQARAAVARARAAAATGKAADFYATAQRALQEAASHDRANAAEALTWREFDAHLTGRGTPAEIRDQAREIFEAGDALRFGGFAPDQAALTAAAARLDGLVEQLLRRA